MHLSIEVVCAFLLFTIVVLLVLKRQVEVSNNKSNSINIESTKYLGNKHRIVIVKAGDKRVLVGVTPSTISRLCELSETVYEVKQSEESDSLEPEKFRDAI